MLQEGAAPEHIIGAIKQNIVFSRLSEHQLNMLQQVRFCLPGRNTRAQTRSERLSHFRIAAERLLPISPP
jgi:hypothetical protein